jgi:hypothetical protein
MSETFESIQQSTDMNRGCKFFTVMAAVSSSCLCLVQTSTTANTTSEGSAAPYTEGTVWQITMIRAKPGMTDDYLKHLAKTFKVSLDEEKKQGFVVSYKVLLGEAATASDYDIMTIIEYKDMAALDDLRAKTDPIAQKIIGGEDQQRETAMKRAEVREIVGSKLMREILLK